jgi:hypothetical protein
VPATSLTTTSPLLTGALTVKPRKASTISLTLLLGTSSAVLTGSLRYLLPTNLIVEQTARFGLARANRSLGPILAHELLHDGSRPERYVEVENALLDVPRETRELGFREDDQQLLNPLPVSPLARVRSFLELATPYRRPRRPPRSPPFVIQPSTGASFPKVSKSRVEERVNRSQWYCTLITGCGKGGVNEEG